MTIDEAIKELESALADKWCPWSPELKASIKLGIEALKAIKKWRAEHRDLGFLLMLRETKE